MELSVATRHAVEFARYQRQPNAGMLANMELGLGATDEEILIAVEEWIDDLARGDYSVAFNRTKHDPYYKWTPQLIESVVNGYGRPEPHRRGPFTVTPRAEAVGELSNREVSREVSRSALEASRGAAVAEVWHDLPFNGEWSDLTVTFRLERNGSSLNLVLQEIHVF